MRFLRIINTVFAAGIADAALFAGNVLPADDEAALRQKALGNAEDVDSESGADEPAADESPQADAMAKPAKRGAK